MTGAPQTNDTQVPANSADFAITIAQATAGEVAGADFFDAFLGARFYCERPERPGFMSVGKPPDGLVPIFSSLEELGLFAGECYWFATTGADLLSLLPDGYDLILNPAGDHPLRLRSAAWEARPRLDISYLTIGGE